MLMQHNSTLLASLSKSKIRPTFTGTVAFCAITNTSVADKNHKETTNGRK
uniref:Glutamate receptor n=1 Tax=Rhizophora mucronata TaxID=61149 RepID=A0A2P2QPT5_RHIMU